MKKRKKKKRKRIKKKKKKNRDVKVGCVYAWASVLSSAS